MAERILSTRKNAFSTDSNLYCHEEETYHAIEVIKSRIENVVCDEVDQSFVCTLCDMQFYNQLNLCCHLKTKHWNKETYPPSDSLECSVCALKFSRKDSLIRHIESMHNANRDKNQLFTCAICEKSCFIKNNLRRHIIACHATDKKNFKKRALCTQCGMQFSGHSSLSRHFKIKHRNKETDFLECSICASKFSRKDVLIRHIKNTHNANRGEHPSSTCAICGQNCSTKSSLKRHIMVCHATEKNFKKLALCTQCGVQFCSEASLRRHCKIKHPNEEACSPSDFPECSVCATKFSRKDTLLRHIRRTHGNANRRENRPSSVQTAVCLKCGVSFRLRAQLKLHYERHHDIVMEQSQFEFPSYEAFKMWKKAEEQKSVTHFRIRTEYKTTEKERKLFVCHRSGIYKDACGDRPRKRHLKMTGSKKLQGCCPAEMNVRINHINGTCSVYYLKTHVGHNVGDEKELCHVYLDEDEKMDLASKIASGVPLRTLKKKIYLSDIVEERGNRLSITNISDLHNIAVKFNLKGNHSITFNEDKQDKLDVDAFVDQYEDSILYCKMEDEEDENFKTLRKSDFVIILMNEELEENLKKHGDKLVYFDGTRGTKPYDFILHTMLVIDENRIGRPVAFLISNRNDQTVTDIFLTLVRERGEINTQTIMTDMQPIYYNSWVKIMGMTPEFHLFSRWHVHKAWRANLSKISDREKKSLILQKLYNLADETDLMQFNEKLDKFLAIKDENVQKFLKYFRENYVHNVQCWADCYRINAGIDPDMTVEEFHRAFKFAIAKSKNMKTWTDCLRYLDNYVEAKGKTDRTDIIGQKCSSWYKLDILRNRHYEAAARLKNEPCLIIPIDSRTTLVQSFQKCDEIAAKMYTVVENDSKECVQLNKVCRLMCTVCNICYHEYKCDCIDSAIQQNMCKHIHVLGMSRNNLGSFENDVLESHDSDEKYSNILAVDINLEPEACSNLKSEAGLELELESNLNIEPEDDLPHKSDVNWNLELETNIKPESKKREKIEQMTQTLRRVLSMAHSMEDLTKIQETFIDPIESLLKGKDNL